MCSVCLSKMINDLKENNKNEKSWLLKCPWDQEWYLMNSENGLEKFPPNRQLLTLLEKREN